MALQAVETAVDPFASCASMLERLSKSIEEGVLSRSSELSARELSLAASVRSVATTALEIVRRISRRASREGVAHSEGRAYVYVEGNSFKFAKLRPSSVVLAFEGGSLRIQTRRFVARLSEREMEYSDGRLSVKFEPANPKAYVEMYSEVKAASKVLEEELSSWLARKL
ncbi:MAG: hypothetical protein ABWK00_01610 [Desulfurococcaceae archaeon]